MVIKKLIVFLLNELEEPKKKKQSNIIFIDKKLAIRVIMDCRKTSTHKIGKRLGFKQ